LGTEDALYVEGKMMLYIYICIIKMFGEEEVGGTISE
jgi:hypothetical protein